MQKRILLLLAVLMGAVWLLLACQPGSKPVEDPTGVVTDPLPTNPLTGLVPDLARTPLMWVVDNHPSARPQDGFASADMIYEVPVEGGLTRFLFITASKAPGVIGPLRSARGYFTQLASEYNASIVHHGSSATFPQAIDLLGVQSIDLRDAASQPIWRDGGRTAPHNLYSGLSELVDYVERGKPKEYIGRRWLFSGTKPVLGQVTYISLIYPGGYTVEYRLGSEGSYIRMTDGVRVDFTLDNILVQQTSVRDGAEVSVDVCGTGTAYFFTRGQVFSGTWVKDTPAGPTIFCDVNGKEWELTPGKTIIHVVPVLTAVQYR